MAGKAGRSGRPGFSRPAGPGRNPISATLRVGTIVFLSQVWPGGEHSDLGRGVVGEVRRINNDRTVIIPQPDGSEIRIVVADPST